MLNPTERHRLFAGGKAVNKSTVGKKGRPTVHSKLPTTQTQVLNAVKWPAALHSKVDVPAISRSKVIAGASMMNVAQSTLRVANMGKPVTVDLFFDLADRKRYPKQREAVQRKRAVTMPYDKVVEMMQMVGKTTLAQLADIDGTQLPLLKANAFPWHEAFAIPEFKALAWRALAEALRVCAVNEESPTTYNIHCADGKTTHTIVGGVCTTCVVPKPEPTFGEADLRVMQNATMANRAGKNVVVHTIDTDFLAMAVCAAWHTPEEGMFLIALKTAVYNVALLLKCIGGSRSACNRLNAGFWMFGMGSDYSLPLTHNGYYRKDIVPRIKDERGGPFQELDGNIRFVVEHAVSVLRTQKCRTLTKRKPTKTVAQTAMDMYFCCMYYGRYFKPAIEAAPKLLPPQKSPISLPLHILQ